MSESAKVLSAGYQTFEDEKTPYFPGSLMLQRNPDAAIRKPKELMRNERAAAYKK